MTKIYQATIVLLALTYTAFFFMPYIWQYMYSDETIFFLGIAGTASSVDLSGPLLYLLSAFYLISYIIKSVPISEVTTLLAMLFEFPKDYFEKMRNGGVPNEFPKNNPTGMPWNLTSISIIKLILFFAKISGIETSNTYFNRMLK